MEAYEYIMIDLINIYKKRFMIKKKNSFLKASESMKIFNLKQYKKGAWISLA